LEHSSALAALLCDYSRAGITFPSLKKRFQ